MGKYGHNFMYIVTVAVMLSSKLMLGLDIIKGFMELKPDKARLDFRSI